MESKGAEVSGEQSLERNLKEKLKEDHRKGLNRLKSSLQSARAMEIGSFQQKPATQQVSFLNSFLFFFLFYAP